MLELTAQNPRCSVYHGDNREFVKAIPDLIRLQNENPAKALGSVLCDPNGIGLPVAELSELSGSCSRLDLVLNYPARTWKRERAAGHKAADIVLADMLRLLHKQHWLIQEPLASDRHEWMIMVGRNFGMGDWQKFRFHHLDSPKGRQILLRALSINERTSSLF